MKKGLIALSVAVMSVLGILMLPTQNASAVDCNTHFLGLPAWYDGLTDDNCNITPPPADSNANGVKAYVWTIALNVVSMVMGIVGYLAIGLVMWGGIQYMIAQGDPVKLARGKKTIFNSVIGLAIVMTASIISGAVAGIISGVKGSTNGKDFFQGIFNKVFIWSGIIAVIMIIYGGIQYVTSVGNPQTTSKAKNTLIYSVVGLLIVIFAAAIVNVIVGAIPE